nr:hypothetical protein MACL_00003498 [Theileria orientalis]
MYIWIVFKSLVYILLFWKKFVLTDPDAGPPAESKKPVDLNIKSATKSTDKFEYKKDEQFSTYTAKEGHGFKILKEDNTTIWEASDDASFSAKVEVETMGDGRAATVYLDENSSRIFIRSGTGKPWTEIDKSKVTPKSINVDYPTNSHFYTNTLDNGVRTFIAREGFAFNAANKYVNNNKIELWKTDDESQFSTKVVNDGNKVTIHLPDGTEKVVEKGSDGKWPGEGSGDSQSAKKADPAPSSSAPPKKKNGIDINLKSDTKSGRKFNFEKDGKIITYTPKDNNAFKMVKDDKAEIWRAGDFSNYAEKLEVDTMNDDAKAISIHMSGDKKRVFMKDSKSQPWKEIDITKVNAKSVNINYEHTCYFYSNKLENGVRTFTAKSGFMFNHVRCLFNNEWVDIWKTDDESQYCLKVVAESDKVTIFKGLDDVSKVFNKVADDKWEEAALPASASAADPSGASTIIFDSDDENDIVISELTQPKPVSTPSQAPKPIHTTTLPPQPQQQAPKSRDQRRTLPPGEQPQEITILIEGTTPNDTSRYTVKEGDNLGDVEYIIKKGSVCNEVKVEGSTVWKSGDDQIPQAFLVSYNRAGGQLSITGLNRLASYRKQDNGSWTRTSASDLTAPLQIDSLSSEDERGDIAQPTPSDSQDSGVGMAQLVPQLTPRRQPPQLSTVTKTALHILLCSSLSAENIIADLDRGLHVSDFKFIHMAMWKPFYGTVDVNLPLLSRPLFALVNTDDGWASQYIGKIEDDFCFPRLSHQPLTTVLLTPYRITNQTSISYILFYLPFNLLHLCKQFYPRSLNVSIIPGIPLISNKTVI